MNKKIFITGPSTIDKLNIAKVLVEKNDDLSIAERFTNNDEYINSENDEYIYYLSTQEIDLSYKNNALLFVNTNNYISNGITLDSYYNNDICVMSLCEFNNISDVIFKSELNDIVVIWVDSNIKNNLSKEDVNETEFLQERINSDLNIKYMYFFNESIDNIVNIILEYLDADEVKKNELLEENN
jgi:hypothetical protein